jgi:hypothetical protein
MLTDADRMREPSHSRVQVTQGLQQLPSHVAQYLHTLRQNCQAYLSLFRTTQPWAICGPRGVHLQAAISLQFGQTLRVVITRGPSHHLEWYELPQTQFEKASAEVAVRSCIVCWFVVKQCQARTLRCGAASSLQANRSQHSTGICKTNSSKSVQL